jgi:hypothetical protein
MPAIQKKKFIKKKVVSEITSLSFFLLFIYINLSSHVTGLPSQEGLAEQALFVPRRGEPLDSVV